MYLLVDSQGMVSTIEEFATANPRYLGMIYFDHVKVIRFHEGKFQHLIVTWEGPRSSKGRYVHSWESVEPDAAFECTRPANISGES